MGIFTRFKDIVSSNLNSMLDRAEDPEKMIRLMIQEMEETMVELKAGCAGLMADRKRIGREHDEVLSRMQVWEDRARLAVEKGREDLAREALMEKHRLGDVLEGLENEQNRFDALVEQSREDLAQLEEKLESARERQRSLVKRHIRAGERVRARNDISRSQSNDVMMRFDRFEARVERMEAEAELAGPSRNRSLEDEFSLLEGSDQIEAELEALRQARGGEAKAEPKK
ncbi:phage shock protein PspA [Salidesulfovibrio onnuriiensis]|uniref:phage shock protein PspA n=1 Tax=Salidesulfovibrio onnuriiensis TaxID=2583823 RepID=UPI0011CC1FAC|nr:phage shock protein PspA [Salidesulfovibrio onnuriiensis]